MDKLKWKRIPTCLAVLGFVVALGTVTSLGNGIWSNIRILGFVFLDFFDFITNSVIMPIVAIITCILVGYIIKPRAVIEEVEFGGAKFKAKKLFSVMIKYVAPICIVAILIFSVLEALGVVKV